MSIYNEIKGGEIHPTKLNKIFKYLKVRHKRNKFP